MTDNFAAFYTPESVAQILADWAISDSNDKVIDPSFGGCAFLSAALNRLQELGSPLPGSQIYGVDIDPSAQTYLELLYSSGAGSEQFVKADFFEIAPDQFDRNLFDVVVGNPPYIRYHSIPEVLQERAVEKLALYNMEISGRSSYWAFFLLYSIQFLKPGGRLAMVLPGAFLHTDYASRVRELVIKNFEKVTIFLLEERIFQNTEEESILLCAEGAHRPHVEMRIGSASTVDELGTAFAGLSSSTSVFDQNAYSSKWLNALVNPATLQKYNNLTTSADFIHAGDWLQTRIGVVTGRNDYFILSSAEWNEHQLPNQYQKPIVRKAVDLSGLWVTDERLKASLAKSKNKKHLLLSIAPGDALEETLKRYIALGVEEKVDQAAKCNRTPWFSVPHTDSPQAFMPIMAASWPYIVINRSSYTCTNNILKLSWKAGDRDEFDWLRLALGSLSTISQLSAELVGRSYGGGVLKLEPKEFANLVIPLLPNELIKAIAPKVDQLLVHKKNKEASNLIDKAIVSANIGLNEDDFSELKAARNLLFIRRRNHRKDAHKLLN